MLGVYVPPTAKVMRRRDLGLKSHPKDRRSPGSNSRPQVYKASDLTTTPRRLLTIRVDAKLVDTLQIRPQINHPQMYRLIEADENRQIETILTNSYILFI